MLAEYLQSRGVHLQRSGVWLRGLCPFHGERTPSFYVYDEHAHCYGCGAHLHDLIDAIWKLEFPNDPTRRNAFKHAKDLHYPVREMPPLPPKEAPLPTERQVVAMQTAMMLWREYLIHPVVGAPAHAWLTTRKLQGPLMESIWPQIGFAPQGPRACSTLAERLKVVLGEDWWDVATSIGLLSLKGNFLYRNRLIFTTTRHEHLVFFQGRTLDETTGGPKYLNPFNIRKSAFIPISYAQAIYQGTAICEGPLDAFALAASGIYAIGLAGSHLKSLHAGDVIGPVFDYLDNEPELINGKPRAGILASEKLQQWCQEQRISYQKAQYPDQIKDPSRWVTAYGAEALARAHRLLAA